MLEFLALGLSLAMTILSSVGALYYRYYEDFYESATMNAQLNNKAYQFTDIHDKALRPFVQFAILPSIASSVVFMLCYWMDQRPWNRFQKLFYTVFNAPIVWIIAMSLFIAYKLTTHAPDVGDS